MDPQTLALQLVSLPDEPAQHAFLAEHAALLDDQFASALKAQADNLRHSDVQRSLHTAKLLCTLPSYSGNPCHRALGLLAEANALSIGLGQYARAVGLYDEAAQVYRAQGKIVEQATAQIGKIYSLANLGRYDEVWATGEAVAQVLKTNARWLQLGGLMVNLAIVHGRQGDDVHALAMFEQAREYYLMTGTEGQQALPWIDHNRAIVLRNLGRFEESIQASHASQQVFADLGQQVEVARSRQNLALTHFVLGQHNEALALLTEARAIFLADGRERDALLVDLFTSDCLLQLRRFGDVLEKCRQVRALFTNLGTRFEVAQAILKEATAYAGLRRYTEAFASIREARGLFDAEKNPVWAGYADLEAAAVLQAQERHDESLALAQACAATFRAHDLPVDQARATLAAGRALVGRQQYAGATKLVSEALACGESLRIPDLVYRCHHLAGAIAAAQGQAQAAMDAYDRAIDVLESLRGRIMVEYRAGFLEDKGALYEDIIDLCLDQGLCERGLQYAERAKSRALLDLLAYRLNLEVRPRAPADVPLIERLVALRSERDRLYRRWDTEAGLEIRGSAAPDDEAHQLGRDILDLERQITELWHTLLVRQADYAYDAALWSVHTEPVQPYLGSDTVLIEYFTVHRQFVAFLVTRDRIEARRLPCGPDQIQDVVRLLQLNLQASVAQGPGSRGDLADNAQRLLRQLHDLLIAPLADILAPREHWLIVPHGPLHYLPFHAFHNGSAYLLERHTISYLPAASLLRYCTDARQAAGERAVFAHSLRGRLPHVLAESAALGTLLGARTFVDDAATVDRLREVAPQCDILHVAAHGDFRPDNPLFSGLALADGWLTTLDIFSLHLNAALVTLSACQTGESVIGGGDELLGLMRAFLYAGAASLVLSLWPVEDHATADLMTTFYRELAAGRSKAAALREAQLSLVRGSDPAREPADRGRAHPYFWAPFFLVGHSGPLG